MKQQPDKKKVGFLTIGQSPREDVIPEIKPLLGEEVTVVEVGALDELSPGEITALSQKKAGEVLITRLRNGQSVTLPRASILALLQEKIDQLEHERVSALGLLCTEDFPELKSRVPLLQPCRLMATFMATFPPGSSILIIIPLDEQKNLALEKWARIRQEEMQEKSKGKSSEDYRLQVSVLNPYHLPRALPPSLIEQGRRASLIVLDCIGYPLSLKKQLSQTTGRPVLLPRSILARSIRELI
ncbi:AroM family protein [Candidatus Aminicenantes bacterium AC-334-K16]|jgi:protein AroM|nr:AroM family protein [Candidatus Aminicenantes bacterium AC-334-K16]